MLIGHILLDILDRNAPHEAKDSASFLQSATDFLVISITKNLRMSSPTNYTTRRRLVLSEFIMVQLNQSAVTSLSKMCHGVARWQVWGLVHRMIAHIHTMYFYVVIGCHGCMWRSIQKASSAECSSKKASTKAGSQICFIMPTTRKCTWMVHW